ncbi:MAG: type I-E CRISPR-associated protein Cse1/CasA [Bacillota bacterium]|nr:type I-E CRISPR-associated protein Cse1/CasA [Bacillota bacterium]
MKEIEYNLIEERWIKVTKQDGTTSEESLYEVLVHAHEYRSLGGEMAAQDMAILRCLIALMHTVICRMDCDGKDSFVQTKEDCIERWKEVWKKGCFSEVSLQRYFEQWHDRFWLFHPERPFYQVPQAVNGTENGVNKLNGEVSESNNKIRLFSHISGIAKEQMGYPESARWLLFLNGFDDCAAKQKDKSEGKRGSSVGWLGKLGLIYSIGNNLFETILLNMPMVTGQDEDVWSADIPTWELETVRSKERETIIMPDNLAALYTLQSRRIFLKRTDSYVTGYGLLGGDFFDDKNTFKEPMTMWKKIEDKKTKESYFRPYLHERNRHIWRDFSALAIENESSVRPGIVKWIDYLSDERVIPRKRLLTFGVVCVRHDSSQSGSITDSFADDVLFHADLLSEAGKNWQKSIEKQLKHIRNSIEKVDNFVKSLRRAGGQNENGDDSAIEEARIIVYQEIDPYFRKWLLQLDSDQEAEERDKLALQLEEQIRACFLRIGESLIDQVGEAAFIGRMVEVKKKKFNYSAPQAYLRFKKGIYEIYPKVKGDEMNEE